VGDGSHSMCFVPSRHFLVPFLLAACGSSPAPVVQPLGATSSPPTVTATPMIVEPAPITTTGHVAGQPTDYVFVLVADADPATPGLGLGRGEALRVRMPPAFVRDPATPIVADRDTNLVLTKGWPQGAVPLAGQYQIRYDDRRNAIDAIALVDMPAGAPGIKVIHLRGTTFVNPTAGEYSVVVEHVDASGTARRSWTGTLAVVERVPAARVAPTNFHVPPGTSSNFQHVAPSQRLAHPLGLLLWADGAPLDGVGIAPRDLERFARYTGGLLIADTNGDHVLEPDVDRVVGGIIGAAPKGAKGQAATSVLGPDRKPVLSGEVLRHPAFPSAGGKTNPGLLVIDFQAGDLPGNYRPTFELVGGNAFQFTILVDG
jgi:hypothetical protein